MEKRIAQAKVKEFGKPHPDLEPPEVFRPSYALKEPPIEVDPITYEIILHRLWYLTLSFGETLKNVSGSPVTSEACDLAIVLALEDGAPVFIAPYISFQALVGDLVISNTIKYNQEDPGIRDGDMFLTNDPYLGVAHQPDTFICCPIFVDGELFCWSGSSLHQQDIGGIDPGSMCPNAKDIYAEPYRYLAARIVENDKFRPDIDRMIRSNSRLPDIVALDLRGMISANLAAKKSLLGTIEKYGKDVVKSVMIMAQNKTSEVFKRRLKELPHGTFRGRDFFEIGGTAPELQDEINVIECTLTNTGEKLIFDFSGTSKQSGGFVNCSVGCMRAGTIQAFLEQLAFDIPWNAGLFVNIEIITQKGTVHNPLFPSASGGSAEGGVATYSTALQPVAQMAQAHEELKRKSLICSNVNSFPACSLAGIKKDKRRWGTLLLDGMVAGFSANAGRDGLDAGGTTFIPFTHIQNVETAEFHFPFLYVWRRMGKESIGAGYNRGGGTLEYALTPHGTPSMRAIFWTHGMKMTNSLGISGGLPSAAHRIKLARESHLLGRFKQGYYPVDMGDFSWEPVSPKSDFLVYPDDILLFGGQGSGGYGDPIKREPERVLTDVKSGFVPIETARKLYGVIIDPERLALDLPATQKEREGIIGKRLKEGRFPGQWGRLVPPDFNGEENNALEHPMDPEIRCGDPRDGRTLLVVGDARKIVRMRDNSLLWVCADCNYVYGTMEENPKLRSKMRIGYLNDLANPDAQTYGLEKPEFFYREFYCPQCGVMWEGEVAREIDPILNSVEYDSQWLKSL